MDEYQNIQIFFRTRNDCIIKMPKHLKAKQAIYDFILDKIASDELECWVEQWVDFEIEDFKICDEEEEKHE
jgi:hypothetical protein